MYAREQEREIEWNKKENGHTVDRALILSCCCALGRLALVEYLRAGLVSSGSENAAPSAGAFERLVLFRVLRMVVYITVSEHPDGG